MDPLRQSRLTIMIIKKIFKLYTTIPDSWNLSQYAFPYCLNSHVSVFSISMCIQIRMSRDIRYPLQKAIKTSASHSIMQATMTKWHWYFFDKTIVAMYRCQYFSTSQLHLNKTDSLSEIWGSKPMVSSWSSWFYASMQELKMHEITWSIELYWNL